MSEIAEISNTPKRVRSKKVAAPAPVSDEAVLADAAVAAESASSEQESQAVAKPKAKKEKVKKAKAVDESEEKSPKVRVKKVSIRDPAKQADALEKLRLWSLVRREYFEQRDASYPKKYVPAKVRLASGDIVDAELVKVVRPKIVKGGDVYNEIYANFKTLSDAYNERVKLERGIADPIEIHGADESAVASA